MPWNRRALKRDKNLPVALAKQACPDKAVHHEEIFVAFHDCLNPPTLRALSGQSATVPGQRGNSAWPRNQAMHAVDDFGPKSACIA